MASNNVTTTKSVERQWFAFYKPTQGYWTRLCTAIGVGSLALWGGKDIFERLSVYTGTMGLYLQVGASVAWLLGFAMIIFWLVGRKVRTVDFFIAVEGEMKKVNWSTKQEIVGATKVVMVFVALLSVMLFMVDTGFMLFFTSIHVLRLGDVGDIFKGLFGFS